MAALQYVKVCFVLCICIAISYLSALTTKTVRRDFEIVAKYRSNPDLDLVASVQLQTTAAKKPAKPNKYIVARENLTKKMTREKTIQIFLPGIRLTEMKITSSLTRLKRYNQTTSLPLIDSCAIVGNSGVLLASSCGDVIDKANIVLRMNLAPAGGEYARDVGSKTNITTINGEQSRAMSACAKVEYTNTSVDNLPDDCRSLLKLMRRLNNSVIWCVKGFTLIKHIRKGLEFYEKYHGLKTSLAYSPASPVGTTGKWMKVRHATTGAAVYLAATTFCRRITLFGFYPRYVDPTNRTLRYHYYDDTPKNYSTSPHSFNKEFDVWQSLENDGYLQVINDCAGRWDKHDYHSQLDT
ncbi:alpha-2,8-sialyltransferase 8B-like [Diadema antillarum]|uniref:alpha-2,8-sialyltransferase 8B-like n=1 Tax=Diadema antillarum TaxID=105358 RepID=UPI003A84DF5B